MNSIFAVILAIAMVVVAVPTEKPDLSGGMSDLISSINRIQEKVKGMRGLASGNHTSLDQEIMDGINDLSKNVTYENLIDRVQQASKKVQELQKRLSGALKDLDKNYQRPGDKTENPVPTAA